MVTMILSEKEVQVTSVRMPSMCAAACLVVAGKEAVGSSGGVGMLDPIGKGMLQDFADRSQTGHAIDSAKMNGRKQRIEVQEWVDVDIRFPCVQTRKEQWMLDRSGPKRSRFENMEQRSLFPHQESQHSHEKISSHNMDEAEISR